MPIKSQELLIISKQKSRTHLTVSMLDTQKSLLGNLGPSDPLSYSSLLDEYEVIFPDGLDTSDSSSVSSSSSNILAYRPYALSSSIVSPSRPHLASGNYDDGSTTIEIFHYHKNYPLYAYRPQLPTLPEEGEDGLYPAVSGARIMTLMAAKCLLPHVLERLGGAVWDGVHHLESLLAPSHSADAASEVKVSEEEIDFEEFMEYAMDEFEAF